MEKPLNLVLSLLCLALVLSAVPLHAADEAAEKWVVYYGEAFPAERFMDYKVIAFDSQKHPPLRPLMNRGKTLLGYLSIGEAEDYRYDFKRIKAMGALMQENPNWTGHYIVDIRNRQWIKYLIEVKIPLILHKNFDGLMLDTLDGPLYLWEKDRVKYAGMNEAAVNLLATIRKHYPNIKLMVNRGFHVLPEIAPYVDMVLAESIMAGSHPDTQKPILFDEPITQEYADIITQAQEKNEDLKVYSLDYWPADDEEIVKKIYQRQRERGYVPYVTTIDLMQEHKEPN